MPTRPHGTILTLLKERNFLRIRMKLKGSTEGSYLMVPNRQLLDRNLKDSLLKLEMTELMKRKLKRLRKSLPRINSRSFNNSIN
jgi:hypothetical protein